MPLIHGPRQSLEVLALVAVQNTSSSLGVAAVSRGTLCNFHISFTSTSTLGRCASTAKASVQLFYLRPSVVFQHLFFLPSASWINFWQTQCCPCPAVCSSPPTDTAWQQAVGTALLPFHCARIHSRISCLHCRFIPAAACLLLLSALMYSFRPGSLGRISFIPQPFQIHGQTALLAFSAPASTP